MTYYRYKDVCHVSLNEAVLDEFDDGVFQSNDVLYSPVSFHLGTSYGSESVLIEYYTSTGTVVSVPRIYPVCEHLGYQSVSGLAFSDALGYNFAIVTLWCIAFAIRSSRRVL